MLSGQNGILNRAQEANGKTKMATQDEDKKLQVYKNILTKYSDNLPSTEETTPYLPNNTFSYKEGDLGTGLVIKDSNGNEFVWVEVPTTIYENSTYNNNGANKPNSSDDYEKIQACLKVYTSDYSDSNYSDTNPILLTEYKNMLNSVHKNGGFWIGRYESGLEDGKNPRTSYVELTNNDKAVVKSNMVPYNYVTRDDAQILAQRMNYEDCTSSLIFGLQWDLILKYIEIKKPLQKSNLATDSTSIGNYYNSEFTLERGKFAQYNALYNWYSYNTNDKTELVNNGQKVQQSSNSNAILLTTGATEATNLQNIYDIAGNVYEWTLEFYDTESPCVARGGGYASYGVYNPAKYHGKSDINYCNDLLSFRIGLWK